MTLALLVACGSGQSRSAPVSSQSITPGVVVFPSAPPSKLAPALDRPTVKRNLGSKPTLGGDVKVGDFPEAIAAGEGTVWVTGSGEKKPWLMRIKESSNRVTNRWSIANPAEDMAEGYGSVWAAVATNHSVPYAYSLMRFGNRGSTQPVRFPDVHGPTTIGGGSVWSVTGDSLGNTQGPPTPP
jgi:hypothetical protein